MLQALNHITNLSWCLGILLDSFHSYNISFQLTTHSHHPVECGSYLGNNKKGKVRDNYTLANPKFD